MSRSPKLDTDALHNIATAQRTIVIDSVVVRRMRSARTPKGRLATAPTSDVAATSNPMSVLLMCRPRRNSVAEAPTVETSAALNPRTQARTTMTRARSRPPSATVSRSAPASAAADASAATPASSEGRDRSVT